MTPAFLVPDAWRSVLEPALATAEAHRLAAFLEREKLAGKHIYPPDQMRFHALELVPPERVKVVILGQDPYHGKGQAHGLAFSVPDGVSLPPSLRNIFKEIERDLHIRPNSSGNLQRWAEQGVLLLNTVLSVEEAKAGSHQGLGWEAITDAVIRHSGHQETPCVFMLWGGHAQKKSPLIDGSRHLVLEAPHPSPLSAHRGFIGCGHFGKANDFLATCKIDSIAW